MKRYFVPIVMLLAIGGCVGSGVIAHDEDGDGSPDVMLETGPLGQVVEVEGSREALAQAGTADGIAAEILALAAALGVSGAAYAGTIWGKWKPVKLLAAERARFAGVVKSVQEGKGALTPYQRGKLGQAIHKAQERIPGLEEAITEIKAAKT